MTLRMTVKKPDPRIVTAPTESEPRALRPPDWSREGVPQLRVVEVEGTRICRLGLGHAGPWETALALSNDVEVAAMDMHRMRRLQVWHLYDVVDPHAARRVCYGVIILTTWLRSQKEWAEVLCFKR